MRRKRTKQLIAILLSITIITLSTAKPYQEAKATGLLEGIAGAALGLSAAEGVLIGTLIAGGIIVASGVTWQDVLDLYQAGKRGDIQKAAEKSAKQLKNDFVKYSTQALNNNVSAAEQERENAAHAKSVIEDFLESLSNGVIDTTSEAWGWFKDFCSDIKAALAPSESMNGYIGKNLDGMYTDVLVGTPLKGFERLGIRKLSIELKGCDMEKIDPKGRECFLALQATSAGVGFVVCAINDDGTITKDINAYFKRTGAMYRMILETADGIVEYDWETFTSSIVAYKGMYDDVFQKTYGLPLVDTLTAAPSGTTDVPGVSNVNDYVSIGSDLPYTRPEGAWDICDPNGKKGQISIGKDIPGKMGYDDWYDVLGGIANGEATWEQVANASDVIRIGSDADSPYSSDNADAWDSYVDGTIIGYDVTAEGDVVITLEGGKVITIPQEYAGSIEFTNEQDKAQELDKDTAFPVSGTLAYPLPGALEGDPTADPDPGGGGGGSVTVDPDVSDYTLDFRKLFPFCIPFDIYKAVKLLDATPTAPVVHYKFYLSKSKTYTIDLNLNKFNTVAAILRRMECLLFIIGLATATRRIYIRG